MTEGAIGWTGHDLQRLLRLRVSVPIEMGISKRVNGYTSREVCPWNEKFATREALGESDTRTIARELPATTQEELSTAFKGSPMTRAKLRGLKRNAAVAWSSN